MGLTLSVLSKDLHRQWIGFYRLDTKVVNDSSVRVSKAVFIIFPKLETRFNTHYQNVYTNAFRNVFLELLRLYHRTLSRVRVEREALSLRSCIAQFDP